MERIAHENPSDGSAVRPGRSTPGARPGLAVPAAARRHSALLADFEPKGRVAGQYGVYRKRDGVAERALFVVDGRGVIRWSYVSPLGVNPGADGILKALEGLYPKEQQHGSKHNDRGVDAPGVGTAGSHLRAAVGGGHAR